MHVQTSFLVSAPRSGNTWMRYILEYILRRQTVGYAHHQGTGASDELRRIWLNNIPLSKLKTNHVLLDVPVFCLVRWDDIEYRDARWKRMFSSSPILKRHSFEDQVDFMFLCRQGAGFEPFKQELLSRLRVHNGAPLYNQLSTSCKLRHLLEAANKSKLIVMARHPIEYLAWILQDDEFYTDEIEICDITGLSKPRTFSNLFHEKAEEWMEILRRYDKYTGPKLLVYYEDLISRPKNTVEKIQDFMTDGLADGQRYLEFFKNYDLHKQNSIDFYKNTNGGESFTKGEISIHHSERFSMLEKKEIDSIFKDLDKEIYEKYVEERYGIK